MNDLILQETDGDIGIITVNNPPVNALSPGVPEGLAGGIVNFSANPAIKAIVIIGSGRTFIAGADIKEFGKITSGQKSDIALAEICLAIEDSAKPVVMAIHGTALGGGLETAMAGHYRVAVASAQVGQPEVKLGIIPGAAGTQRLPRLCGMPLALDMCVYGNPISAQQALEAGIIDEIVADGLLAGAVAFARRVADQPARRTRDRMEKLTDKAANAAAVAAARAQLAKRGRSILAERHAITAVEAAADMAFAEGVDFERRLFMECLFSDESRSLIHVFFGERAVAKVPFVPKDVAPLDIKSVAVVGAGTMGGGIAMVYANAGIPVLLKDSAEGLERGMATIRKNYEGTVAKGRLTPEAMAKRLALIRPTLTYDGFGEVDLVTEAVFENMALKKQVFAELHTVTREGCVLATNTSTMDIDEIASVVPRPEWVIGTHFFSPANVMRLLEVVRGAKTSPQVIATAMALAKPLRKVAVLSGNCFGFIGNRMFGPYRREAQFLVEEGAGPAAVDAALYEFGMAMGPLATGDLAGLDVGWRIRQENPDLFKKAGVRDPRIEDALCEKGWFGQKTGRGWYRYDEQRKPHPDAEVDAVIAGVRSSLGLAQRTHTAREMVDRCVFALVNEGAFILDEGIALRPVDIDIVYARGYGFPAWRGGPMFYANTLGLDKVLARVREFGWQASPLLVRLAEAGKRFGEQAP